MTRLRQMASAAMLTLLLSGPQAQAQTTDNGTFDLKIRGITAGVLAFSGTVNGRGYAVAGKLESTGIIAAIRKVRYDAKAHGSISGSNFTPTRYEEKANTGKRVSESVMEYRSGVPQVKTYSPAREPRTGDVDPATQKGTVDPLTALYAMLRDVPADQACTFSVFMFDGQRRSQIQLGSANPSGDTITCAGEYRRLQGFSDKEMAEKQRFAFTLTYRPAATAGMVRVTEVAMDSLYGRAALTRR